MQREFLLMRSQENDARNDGRTRYASGWSAELATPEVDVTPRPQTSFASTPEGRVRAQASVTSGESGASRNRRNLSSSLPVLGRRKVIERVRPSAASRNRKRR